MIELHRRQSRALLLELLHDEIASSLKASHQVNIFVSRPQILQAACSIANALVCNAMALPS